MDRAFIATMRFHFLTPTSDFFMATALPDMRIKEMMARSSAGYRRCGKPSLRGWKLRLGR